MKARTLVRYYSIYRQHLFDNNLPDDSNEISVEELTDFVENQISLEDRFNIIDRL